MKTTFTFLALLFSLSSFAAVKIEEEAYIMGEAPIVLEDLIRSGSVEIDHVTSKGFEVYGGKGLLRYLDERGLPYINLDESHHKSAQDYPSYAQITARLKELAAKRPSIVSLFSIGKSVKGKELWVVKISDNVSTDEVEPEFKYISSMHGDEITGRELTIELIAEIIEKYGKDRAITELVNNTEIFIMPSMNPDGSERGQRGNANGIDLNRNFPDIISDRDSKPNGRQVEVQAVMKFQADRKFSLSANFHGGTIVANYPWDSKYDLHPLDQLVQDLSLTYSEHNPEMRNSREFKRGITNGAAWYVVRGGMQDWSYFWFNDLQITVELSHQKWPQYSDIPGFYKDNRDSMIEYMKHVHQGAGFKLKNKRASGSVMIKQVSPVTRDLGTYAFSKAEFYKVLPEGNYEFTIMEKSKSSKKMSFTVDKDTIRPNGNFKVLN